MTELGHNSGEKPTNIAGDRLRGLIERRERLAEEIKALQSDMKDILAEAKSAGFDCRIIRQLERIRRQEPAQYEEEQQLLAVYMHAIGMA